MEIFVLEGLLFVLIKKKVFNWFIGFLNWEKEYNWLVLLSEVECEVLCEGSYFVVGDY